MTKEDKIRLMLVGGCVAVSVAILYGGINFGRDLGGSLSLTIPTDKGSQHRVVDVIRKRLGGLGLVEPAVHPFKEDKVLVWIARSDGEKLPAVERLCSEPGVMSLHLVRRDNAERVVDLLASNSAPDGYAVVSLPDAAGTDHAFYIKTNETSAADDAGGIASFHAPQKSLLMLMPSVVGGRKVFTPYFVDQQPELTNIVVERAWTMKGGGNQWSVCIQLGRDDKLAYREITSKHCPHGSQNNDSDTGRELAVLMDNRILAVSAVPGTVFDGRLFINRIAAPDEAKHLASVCASGSIRCTGRIEKGKASPDLGTGVAVRIMAAVLVGGMALIVLMAAFWPGYGLIAGAGTATGMFLLPLAMIVAAGILEVVGGEGGVRAVLSMPVVTLWVLSGAGLAVVTGLGLCVGVMQRIAQEIRSGRAIEIAVVNGYRRSQGAIIDATVVGLAAGLLLFLSGTAPLKGFAVAMCAGLLAMLVSNLVAVRAFVGVAASSTLRDSLGKTGGDVAAGPELMRKRVYAAALSLAAILLTWGIMIFNGFRGRRIILVPDLWLAVSAAVVIAVLAVAVCVVLRHSLRHAAGVAVAMLNTLLLTTGIFSLSGRPVGSVAAAALVVAAGLSVHSSLGIFDRVRELLQDVANRRKDSAEVFNAAIHGAIWHVLASCGMALVVAVALMIACPGRVLDFGLVLCIGSLCAAFSSVFIAAPVVLVFNTRWAGAKDKA